MRARSTLPHFPARKVFAPPLPLRPGPAPGAPANSRSAPAFHITYLLLRTFGGVVAWGMREYQDDLASVNSARLRALGVIRPDASSAVVSFGEGADALKREVKVWHRAFRNGRGISLFLCPACGGKAQLLKLYDGGLRCRNCLKAAGVQFRIAYGTRAERAAAREKRIEALKAKLAGGPLRLRPLPQMTVARRRELELSLRRALIREREKLLKAEP